MCPGIAVVVRKINCHACQLAQQPRYVKNDLYWLRNVKDPRSLVSCIACLRNFYIQSYRGNPLGGWHAHVGFQGIRLFVAHRFRRRSGSSLPRLSHLRCAFQNSLPSSRQERRRRISPRTQICVQPLGSTDIAFSDSAIAESAFGRII